MGTIFLILGGSVFCIIWLEIKRITKDDSPPDE